MVFDAKTNKSSSVLVKTHDKNQHTMSDFKLSADRQSILFVTDVRHEFGARVWARYAIFNISSQTVDYLDDLVHEADLLGPTAPSRLPRIQYATWGPKSNSIVFIESDDIYYMPNYLASAASGKYLRLTKTGSLSESIKNGLPDSLYRANIFTEPDVSALWWSPDERYLAYLTFDDALVEQTPIEHYAHESNLNPKIHYERYPRAGTVNPLVSVHVVDMSSPEEGSLETSLIAPPAEMIKQKQLDARLTPYVTHLTWLNGHEFLVMWSSRSQNVSILSRCANQRSSIFGSSNSGWQCENMSTFINRIPPSLDAKNSILAATSGGQLAAQRLVFLVLPRPDSIIGDHYHVALLKGDERAPKYLSHGPFDVDKLLSYDSQADSLYFEAKVSDTAERHLYKISAVGKQRSDNVECITCHLSEPCGYNRAHFQPGQEPKRYFVHECLGPSVPVTRLRRLVASKELAASSNQAASSASNDNNLSLSKQKTPEQVAEEELLNEVERYATQYVLNTDKNIESLVKSKQLPIEKDIIIKANQQFPYDIHVKLYLPNETDDEKDKRFPLLIESTDIETRSVWKKFDLDLGKYLASRKQLIYAKIDCIKAGPKLPTSNYAPSEAGVSVGGLASYSGAPSGAESQGDSSSSDYDQLEWPLSNAKVQVDVIKFLIENQELFPYIDRRRVAIWGPSSTSAYVALATTIYDDSKLIQCTIAVSPITNWRYMSSYQAERYFGLPWTDSNNLRYERSNLLKRSNEFALRKLLIVHGTADEQVPVQHSMQFIKSLTEHHTIGGVIHQMQLYPDVGHSLEPVKRHFYMTLDGFLDRCFYQKPITIKATEWKGKVRPKLY